MSLALWEYFWDAVGDVWGNIGIANASPTDSGGGGHLNPKNDDIFPRPDDSFWDVREAYLRSKFDSKPKPRFRTPRDAIKSPPPPHTVGNPLPAASTSPQFFQSPAPNIRPIQRDNTTAQIAHLAKLRIHAENLSKSIQAAQKKKQETQPIIRKNLSPRDRKLQIAKRYAQIVVKTANRIKPT